MRTQQITNSFIGCQGVKKLFFSSYFFLLQIFRCLWVTFVSIKKICQYIFVLLNKVNNSTKYFVFKYLNNQLPKKIVSDPKWSITKVEVVYYLVVNPWVMITFLRYGKDTGGLWATLGLWTEPCAVGSVNRTMCCCITARLCHITYVSIKRHMRTHAALGLCTEPCALASQRGFATQHTIVPKDTWGLMQLWDHERYHVLWHHCEALPQDIQ